MVREQGKVSSFITSLVGSKRPVDGLKAALFIGRDPETGRDVYQADEKHLLVVAQNASGKGSGIIVPNLLEFAGSMLCFDPNLENANVTAGPSADNGFEPFVADPYGHAKGRAAGYRCKWNPLAEINIRSLTVKEDIWAIAEGCIATPRGHSDNAEFFISGARELMQGAIAHVLSTETDPLKRNLPWVRMRVEVEGAAFFKEMESNFAVGGLPAAAARRLRDAGTNEAGGYLTTLLDQTRWLSSVVMQEHLAPKPGDRVFKTEWLHSRKVRFYMGLPGGRTSYQANWVRLFLNWSLLVLGEHKDEPTATGCPVTLCLDEFGNMARLDYIDRHLGELRHYCRLAIFVQGLDQIRKEYPHSYEGFLQNCTKVFFGIEDLSTAEYLSKACGEIVFRERQDSGGLQMREDDAGASFNASSQRHREPFLTAEAIMRLLAPTSGNVLLLVRPYPALLRRVPYWERSAPYDVNPKFEAQHGGKNAKKAPPSMVQSIWDWLRPLL